MTQYLKTIINQHDFIERYFEYLKEQDLIPLDIINAKIEIIDFLYVPYYAETIEVESRVKAEFGNDRKISNERMVYDRTLNKNVIKNEEHTITDWHFQDFIVESSVNNIVCMNNDFSSVFRDDLLSLTPYLISSMTNADEKIKPLSMNVSESIVENKRNSLIDSKIEPLIQRELRNRGDNYKNASWRISMTRSYSTDFYLPVGYIKYNYNGEGYYFIKSLYNGEEIITQPPTDKELESKINRNKNIFSIIFWSYLLLAGFIYYLSTMTGFAHLYTALWVVIIAFTADLIWLKYNNSQNYKENISKRKKLLDKIFEKESDKLIDLVSNLEKPYKEGLNE